MAQPRQTDSFGTIRLRGRSTLLVTAEMRRDQHSMLSHLNVSIKCAKGLSSEDRDLDIVLYLGATGINVPHSIQKRVTLAEGAAQVTVQIPFQSTDYQVFWDVGVFEQGVDIEKKRRLRANEFDAQWHTLESGGTLVGVGIIQATDGWMYSPQEMHDSLELIDQDAQAKATQTQTIVNGIGYGVATTTTNNQAYNTYADIVQIDEVATRWQQLQAHPLWLITGSALLECNARYPETYKALRNYVASGGKLCVHSMPMDESKEQIDLLLGRSQHLPERWNISSKGNDKLWRTKHLLGQVVACDPEPHKIDQTLLQEQNLAFGSGIAYQTRSDADGNWYWRNLIEAVGQPPVWSFAVLVALFGIILGPGLLAFTGRIGRRSLMIFLVPSFAILATGAIIAYGIFHEGLESHARISSITWVDPDSPSAFAWSRQNFFSGLPPNEGLEFSSDTFARACISEETRRNFNLRQPRKSIYYSIEYEEDMQRWKDWLKPRQHQQLLIGHPVEDVKMPIFARQDGKFLEVKNISNDPIPLLILRGENKDYYHITNLPAGASRRAEAIDKNLAASRTARDFEPYRPTVPIELTQSGDSLLDFGRNRSSRTRIVASDIVHSTLITYFGDQLRMPPFSFALIMQENSKIEIPLDATQNDNLHLMVGDYKW
ncbi:MAG: hypothetical protein AAF483_18030 [Planctomycetota bacterium]